MLDFFYLLNFLVKKERIWRKNIFHLYLKKWISKNKLELKSAYILVIIQDKCCTHTGDDYRKIIIDIDY